MTDGRHRPPVCSASTSRISRNGTFVSGTNSSARYRKTHFTKTETKLSVIFQMITKRLRKETVYSGRKAATLRFVRHPKCR